MNRIMVLVAGIILAAGVMMSCGGGEQAGRNLRAADYLPEKIAALDLRQSSPIQTFEGESLYEHINGGAEIYHLYGFVEVATVYYRYGETEVAADVYRFADADRAFGLYASLRPDRPDLVPLGVEGFVSASSLDFVKGDFVVHLFGYDESVATTEAIDALGKAIEELLPGTTDKPAVFARFPEAQRIAATEKFYARSFLGQPFLSDIYTAAYLAAGDTVTLFLGADSLGEKFERWRGQVTPDDETAAWLDNIPFDEGRAFVTDHAFYGPIVAGSIRGRLAGVIGYVPAGRDMLSGWLNSLR